MRDYQRECVQICLDSLAQGARKQVVSLPVGELHICRVNIIQPFLLTIVSLGSGKTVMMHWNRMHDMVVH